MSESTEVIPTDRKERFGWYMFDLANTMHSIEIEVNVHEY